MLIATPENMHFEPCMKAIEAGYNVLLEKPIAQTLPECVRIAEAARRKGVIVGVCHVLRYHPYFIKIKEIVDSGELGEIISISHIASVGLDRTTHGFVRGMWRKEEVTNPMLISKCCHDIDFLLWLTEGTLPEALLVRVAPLVSARKRPGPRQYGCIDCPVEKECPYSAVDLYYNRRDWISNFDVPEGSTLDEVLLRELRTGSYGRCVFRCDNDVVDHQIVSMEMDNEITISFSMDTFTLGDQRETHIRLTRGEIDGDERTPASVGSGAGRNGFFDFSDILGTPFHAGADLNLIEDFVDTLSRREHRFRTSIDRSVESHRICYEAERSRLTGRTVILGERSDPE